MRPARILLIPLVLLLAFAALSQRDHPAQSVEQQPISVQPTTSEEMATVTRIIDGDTIEVRVGEVGYRVRYIGIDSPERGDACTQEATAGNAVLVENATVRMVRDVNNTDRYGRLLRYVYIGDLFVNEELVRRGWAIAKRYPPDTAQALTLEAAQAEAVTIGAGCHALGVWGLSAPAPVSTPAIQTFGASPQFQCDCDRTCRNMTCEEAYYQLQTCGCRARDGDSDGKPCEQQCGG